MDESSYQWHPYPGPLPEEGKVYSIHFQGKNLCLGQHSGQYYAVTDKCPHAGASLGEGWISEQGDVICPLHHIAFNMANGKNTTKEGYRPLTCYPVKQQADKYFIGFPLKKKWFTFWR